uniref:Solute-binding protein family 3/N-terminal domain-containing protein n=1 Tax=Trichogramma kaykai TaxID=54128 RepID=A0ABD2VTG9_9HYME
MMRIINFFTDNSSQLFLKSSSYNATIHQYDPFQKVHSSFNCKPNIQLFPDFIKNLHGFTLRVDMINEPPYVNLLRDSEGSVINIVGSQLNLLKYIAKGMNFHIHFVQRTDDDKNNLLTEIRRDDFFKELKKGNADLIANERIYSSEYEVVQDFEFTEPITYSQFCAVVPILTKSHVHHFHIHQFLNLSVCFIAAIIINFIMRILDFEPKFWKFIIMLQFIFGQSCKREQPKRVSEKIVVFFTIIISIIIFFQIFMSIVEHRLDLEEAKFKSLVDLLDHSFTIQADYEELLIKDRYLSITDKDREHHNLDIDDWKSRENCLERVVLQKNTICLMIESTGQLVEHAGEVLYGKKVMKLMKDCPWKLTTRLVLTKGSPYLQRINKILQYMQASGIQQTFHLEDRSNMNLKNISRVKESKNFHLDYEDVLLYFECTLIWLIIALIIFILELIWNA